MVNERAPNRHTPSKAFTCAAIGVAIGICLAVRVAAQGAVSATAPAEPYECVGKISGECPLNTPFTPDGAAFVTQTADYAVRAWDSRSLRPLTEPLLHKRLSWYRLSANHRTLMTVGGNAVRLWDVATSKPRAVAKVSGDGTAYADLNPAGTQFLTVPNDDTKVLTVWNTDAIRPAFTVQHEGEIVWAGFSPDGKLIATDSLGVGVNVLAADTGQRTRPPIKTNLQDAFSHHPQFDITGERLLAPTATGFVIADPTADHILADEKAQVGFVEGAEFIVGDIKVALRLAPMLGAIRIYDASTGKFERQLNAFSCQADPAGRWAVGETVGPDSTVAVWDLATGDRIQTLSKPIAGSLARVRMSPDGTLVLIETEPRVTTVWRSRQQKQAERP